MSLSINWTENSLKVKFEGYVTYSEVSELDKSIWGTKKFDNLKYAIYDLRDVKEFTLLDTEILEMTILDKSASRWNNKVRLAIVLKDSIIEKRLSDYFKEMTGVGWQIKVFYQYGLAEKWCKP